MFDNILPTARVYPRHTASSVVCTSLGRHLQPGISCISCFPPSPCLPALSLLPIGIFLPLLYRYVRAHFLGTTAEIEVLAKMSPAASCPYWGFYAPKYPKELGELLKRKIPVFSAWCWHQKTHLFSSWQLLFEYCRSFNITLQLRTSWPRAKHRAGTARQTYPALSWGLIQNPPKWVERWSLTLVRSGFFPAEKYSCCELYTGKFHL